MSKKENTKISDCVRRGMGASCYLDLCLLRIMCVRNLVDT